MGPRIHTIKNICFHSSASREQSKQALQRISGKEMMNREPCTQCHVCENEIMVEMLLLFIPCAKLSCERGHQKEI